MLNSSVRALLFEEPKRESLAELLTRGGIKILGQSGTLPLALAIAAFPKKGLGRDAMRAIFRGGFDKLREAGVALRPFGANRALAS